MDVVTIFIARQTAALNQPYVDGPSSPTEVPEDDDEDEVVVVLGQASISPQTTGAEDCPEEGASRARGLATTMLMESGWPETRAKPENGGQQTSGKQ